MLTASFFLLLLFIAVSLSLSETWYCFREKFFLFFFFIKILICLPSSSFDFVLLNVRSTSSLSFERERSCGGLYAAASSHDNTRYKPIGRRRAFWTSRISHGLVRLVLKRTKFFFLSFFLSFFSYQFLNKSRQSAAAGRRDRHRVLRLRDWPPNVLME